FDTIAAGRNPARESVSILLTPAPDHSPLTYFLLFRFLRNDGGCRQEDAAGGVTQNVIRESIRGPINRPVAGQRQDDQIVFLLLGQFDDAIAAFAIIARQRANRQLSAELLGPFQILIQDAVAVADRRGLSGINRWGMNQSQVHLR